jgi:hypothetical protein
MAISKMLICAIMPLILSKKAKPKTAIGARISLNNSAVLMVFISVCQPVNCNCKPIEKSASGPTVDANLSNSGFKGVKSIK